MKIVKKLTEMTKGTVPFGSREPNGTVPFVIFLTLVLIASALHSCKSVSVAGDYAGTVLYAPLQDQELTEKPLLGDYFDTVRTISLEYADADNYVPRVQDVKLTDSNIFLRAEDELYIYDYDGKLARKISRLGRGHGEYLQITDFDIDRERELIYIYDRMSYCFLVYRFDGSFVRKISDIRLHPNEFAVLNDGHLLFLTLDDTTWGSIGLFEADENAKMVRCLLKFPDYMQREIVSTRYLVHINDSVVGCMGLEDSDIIYHYSNDSLCSAFKIRTDMEITTENLQEGETAYGKMGYWETDRFVGLTILYGDLKWLILSYDKQTERLVRYYRDEFKNNNFKEIAEFVPSFAYCYKGSFIDCSDLSSITILTLKR